jgi:hypothetical protein
VTGLLAGLPRTYCWTLAEHRSPAARVSSRDSLAHRYRRTASAVTRLSTWRYEVARYV